MLISAEGKQQSETFVLKNFNRDPNVMEFTDDHGEAEFVIDACKNCELIAITTLEQLMQRKKEDEEWRRREKT